MKRYKLIYFVPDPFTMGRIPVGALVEDGGRVEPVIAAHLPGADCLGGQKSAALLRMIVRDLSQVTSFELPRSISPHAKLDSEQALPSQIENPCAWVKAHLLPHKPSKLDGQKEEKLHDHLVRRATIGYTFFQNWRVHQHVMDLKEDIGSGDGASDEILPDGPLPEGTSLEESETSSEEAVQWKSSFFSREYSEHPKTESPQPLSIPRRYQKYASMDASDLLQLPLEFLRELAGKAFRIVGASKVRGGKTELVRLIEEVRGR